MTISLAITPGSLQGVGPELMLKAIAENRTTDFLQYIWCGGEHSLTLASTRSCINMQVVDKNRALIDDRIIINFMDDAQASMSQELWCLKNAVSLALAHEVNAIVTAPMDKASLANVDGQSFCGQTEFFTHYLGDEKPAMMTFMGGPFIMSLVTTHLPLGEVAHAITPYHLENHVRHVAFYAGRMLNKDQRAVNMVVLGLNPHAGEHGLLGHEEEAVVKPVVAALCADGFSVRGPVPADGFFAYFHELRGDKIPDVVVAMYHDQGLIAYKLLTKGSAVNVTLGLSVPRTSPAHGTASELIGMGKACMKSSRQAILLAAQLAKRWQ